MVAVSACAGDGGTDPGANFTITPPTSTLEVGQTLQLTAVNAPGQVAWASSNSQIASVVPETGFVRANARGQATISAVRGSAVATAEITVTVPPAIVLSSPTRDFDMTVGDADPAAQTVTITNGGDGTLNGLALGATAYSAGQPTGWLTAALGGTTTPATLTLTARRGALAAGTYNAVVPVTASNAANSPQNVVVTFSVVAPASIALSRTTVTIAGIPNTTPSETVDITNGGGRPLIGLSATIAYQGGAQGWLQATLSTVIAPSTLTLTANTAGLAVGSYNAVVTVASTVAGVASKTVAVTLTVSPGPAIALAPPTVAMNAQNGGNPAPVTVSVTNSGGGTLSNLAVGTITYGAGQPTGWLSAAISQATAPATVTLTGATTTLPTGTYTATVPITSSVASNSPSNISVTLTVGPPPTIVLNPTAVTFSSYRGGNLPGQQVVAVTNGGGGTLTGLTGGIVYGPGASGWLGGTIGNTAPTQVVLQPTTTAIAAGTYTAVVTVQSAVAGVASKTINVTYTISSFATDVLPLFSTTFAGFALTPCTSCHNTSSATRAPFNGTPQQAWNVIQPYAQSGELVCRITSGGGCGGAMPLPASAVAIINAWIAAGAPFQ